MKKFAMYMAFACLLTLEGPRLVMAQTNPETQNAQELRRQLDQMRGQMNAIQARIDGLERASTAPAADQQTAAPPAAASTNQVSDATTKYQTFAEDPDAAPRVDNDPLDPKFPGFFRLPGTQTFLKIGGYFKTDMIYDGKPAGDPERFIPASFPVGVPGVNNTTVSIRPTRMNLDFRVPVNELGDVRFFVEADLFGSNSTTPRLRHAYTQVKNFLIGQTFSNFQDPDAGPDGLDFQGPNSQISLRNPQLRYTVTLGGESSGRSLSLSVEKASSDVAFKTPEFNALPNSSVAGLDREISSGNQRRAYPGRGLVSLNWRIPAEWEIGFRIWLGRDGGRSTKNWRQGHVHLPGGIWRTEWSDT